MAKSGNSERPSEETSLWNTEEGKKASTTNNITGIYDMNGCSFEYVAGNYNWVKGDFAGSSEKFDILFKEQKLKYFDVYKQNEVKKGDAITEILSWNDDSNIFINNEYSWLLRGGCSKVKQASGMFRIF